MATDDQEMAVYMPKPSLAKIRETERQSLGEIVQEAARDGAEFVYLATWRNAADGDRVAALANARRCLEKANAYLLLLIEAAQTPEQ